MYGFQGAQYNTEGEKKTPWEFILEDSKYLKPTIMNSVWKLVKLTLLI